MCILKHAACVPSGSQGLLHIAEIAVLDLKLWRSQEEHEQQFGNNRWYVPWSPQIAGYAVVQGQPGLAHSLTTKCRSREASLLQKMVLGQTASQCRLWAVQPSATVIMV